MKNKIILMLLICITMLIGCSKEETFDDFFRRTMKEMHKNQKNYSYSLIYRETNVVHENDSIAIFKENQNNEETIFLAYFEKENDNWKWRQTIGGRWNSPIKWTSMNKKPYIYLGAIDDKFSSKIYIDEKPSKIIDVEQGKKLWYAISDKKDVEVKILRNDGSEEVLEQIKGDWDNVVEY